MFISLSKVSNLLQNGLLPIFSLLWRPFFYHSNGKSQIMGVVYALAIVLINLQEEIGEKQFPYFSLMGGVQKSPLIHVAL